jgi:hypothetical protein
MAPTTIVNDWEAVRGVPVVLSVTWTMNVLAPAVVGVPEIIPVPDASDKPAGKLPEETAQVYGVTPPEADRAVA